MCFVSRIYESIKLDKLENSHSCKNWICYLHNDHSATFQQDHCDRPGLSWMGRASHSVNRKRQRPRITSLVYLSKRIQLGINCKIAVENIWMCPWNAVTTQGVREKPVPTCGRIDPQYPMLVVRASWRGTIGQSWWPMWCHHVQVFSVTRWLVWTPYRMSLYKAW